MAIASRLSEQEYRDLALRDPDGRWELWDGVPVRKLAEMSVEHESVGFFLGFVLQSQMDRARHRVRVGGARLRVSDKTSYMPDVAVIPTELELTLRASPGSLDTYAEPLPLVVEIWSPSTGAYHIHTKLRDYQQRGDIEIWFLHPYERMLTAWRRRPDGTYDETVYAGGVVPVQSLRGVTIDLDGLLDG